MKWLVIIPEVFSGGNIRVFSLGGYSNLGLTNISLRFLLLQCPNTSGVCVSGLVSFALLRNGHFFCVVCFRPAKPG